MTAVPALTTPFTPPGSCLSEFFYDLNTEFVLGPSPTATECFPDGWTPDASFYYSPGSCPLGYTTACNPITIAGVATATCCPSFFTCDTRPTVSAVACISSFSELGTSRFTTQVPIYSSGTRITTDGPRAVSSKDAIHAYAIRIRLSNQQSSSSGATSTSSGQTSSATATKTGNSTGLSTGAKAGIAIGVVLGGILLILALWILLRRRKHSVLTTHDEPTAGEKDFLGPPQEQALYSKAELDATPSPPVPELEAHHKEMAPVELDSTSPALELDDAMDKSK